MAIRAGDLLRAITSKTPWRIIRVGIDGRRYLADSQKLYPEIVWPWADDDILGDEAVRRIVHMAHLEDLLGV